MPNVTVSIGGRNFEVACQAGEEPYLRSAANLLGAHAQALGDQAASVPESRLLLMAGLMLADHTAGLEEQLRAADKRASDAEAELQSLKDREPTTVEVPTVPREAAETLAGLTSEVEALADQLEERFKT